MQAILFCDESFVATPGEAHTGALDNASIHMEGKTAELYRHAGGRKRYTRED